MTETIVQSGVTSSGLTITSGNTVEIRRGGTLDAATITPEGDLFLDKGGVVSAVTILGGSAYLSGRVDTIVAQDGANVKIADAAVISGATFGAGGYTTSSLISSGGVTGSWHDVTLLSGAGVLDYNDPVYGLAVSAGGYLDTYASIQQATILSGGALVDQSASGGSVRIDRGGEVTADGAGGITVEKGGQLWLGSTAPSGDIVSSGGTIVLSAISADLAGVSLASGATVLLVDGASATGVAGGATLVSAAADIVSASGYWHNVTSVGTVIEGVTLTSGNYGNVYSGGAFSRATVSSGGDLTVGGGTARAVDVLSGGYFYEASGTVDNLTVAGGEATQGGGTATNVTIDGGNWDVYGGSDTNVTVASSGNLLMEGHAGNVTVSDGGYVQLISGTLDAPTVLSGGSGYLEFGVVSGGRVSGSLGGVRSILSGTTIASGGAVYVSSSTASDVSVRDGSLFVSGAATGLVVSSGGFAHLVTSSGNGTVLSGGEAVIAGETFSAAIESGGEAEVDGLYAKAALSGVISAGGTVFAYGSVDLLGLSAESGATVALLNGATESGLGLDAGASLTADALATFSAAGAASLLIDATNTLSGGSLGANTSTDIYAGGLMSKVTLHAGASAVLQGGAAESTAVAGGYFAVQAGSADNTTVKSGSTLLVSGGTAKGITVSAGGLAEIDFTSRSHQMYTPTATVDSGGRLIAGYDTSLNDLTVSAGGYAYLDAVVGDLAVDSGGEVIASYDNGPTGGVVADGGTLALYQYTEFDGMSAVSGATIILLGNDATIGDIGVASGATVLRPDVALFSQKGGLAEMGSTLSGVVADNQTLLISSGGVVSGASVTDSFVSVGSGGAADTVSLQGSYVTISGGSVSAVSVFHLARVAVDKGTASASLVLSGGMIYNTSGGTLDGTTIAAGGTQLVYGAASDTLIESGGVQDVSATAAIVANDTIQSGGSAFVYDGTVSGATLQAGGLLELIAQSGATGIAFAAGGSIVLAGFQPNPAAAPSLSAQDVLTISGYGSSVTLQLAGNYANETFHAAPTGYNETLITLSAASVASGGAAASGEFLRGAVFASAAAPPAMVGGAGVRVDWLSPPGDLMPHIQ